jgi:hypothetical protein
MNAEHLKPILVPGPEARRLIGVGTTKYHDMLNKGLIESVFVGGRRMVVYASLERLAAPQTQEAA